MTSFIIEAHKRRSLHSTWKQDPVCPFCRIVRGELPAYRLFENDKIVAILGFFLPYRSIPMPEFSICSDILPLRQGHTLVVPKVHISRLSELPWDFAAAIGEAVTKVAQALTQGTSAA
jgi:diadenosine tetraphosphate (Ap4A) HIT family hydrolase